MFGQRWFHHHNHGHPHGHDSNNNSNSNSNNNNNGKGKDGSGTSSSSSFTVLLPLSSSSSTTSSSAAAAAVGDNTVATTNDDEETTSTARMQFASAAHISDLTLTAELERHGVFDRHVVGLRHVARGVTFSLQPATGVFYVQRESELLPGEYEAILLRKRPTTTTTTTTTTAAVSRRRNTAPTAAEEEEEEEGGEEDDEEGEAEYGGYAFVRRNRKEAAAAAAAKDIDAETKQDAARSGWCLRALEAVREKTEASTTTTTTVTAAAMSASNSGGIGDRMPGGLSSSLLSLSAEPPSRGTRVALDYLNEYRDRHDIEFCTVSQPNSFLRYLVAVCADAVVVAVDCSLSQRALADPKEYVPFPETSGAINAAVLRLAQYLPGHSLLSLCEASGRELSKHNDVDSGGGSSSSNNAEGAPSIAMRPRALSSSSVGSSSSSSSSSVPAVAHSSSLSTSAVEGGGSLLTAADSEEPISSLLQQQQQQQQQSTREPVAEFLTVNAAASSTARPRRRLVICGQGMSGCVAHIAAILLRIRAEQEVSAAGTTIGSGNSSSNNSSNSVNGVTITNNDGCALTTHSSRSQPQSSAAAGASPPSSSPVGPATASGPISIPSSSSSSSAAATSSASLSPSNAALSSSPPSSIPIKISGSKPWSRFTKDKFKGGSSAAAAAAAAAATTSSAPQSVRVRAITFSTPFCVTDAFATFFLEKCLSSSDSSSSSSSSSSSPSSSAFAFGRKHHQQQQQQQQQQHGTMLKFLRHTDLMDHISFCWDRHDLRAAVGTLAAEISVAYAQCQDPNQDARRIMDVAKYTEGGKSILTPSSVFSACASAQLFLDSHQQEISNVQLAPLGTYAFLSMPAPLLSGSGVSVSSAHSFHVREIVTDLSRIRQNVFLSMADKSSVSAVSHPIVYSPFLSNLWDSHHRRLVMESAAAVPVRNAMTESDGAADARGSASLGSVSEVTMLTPRILKCDVVLSGNRRADFVIFGSHLDAILGRMVGVDELVDLTQLPLRLPFEGFDCDASLGMVVMRCTSEEVRIIATQCTFLKDCEIVVQTDFGESRPFPVTENQISRTQAPSAAALLYASLNTEMLEAAYYRGMLALIYHLGEEKRSSSSAASSSSASSSLPSGPNQKSPATTTTEAQESQAAKHGSAEEDEPTEEGELQTQRDEQVGSGPDAEVDIGSWVVVTPGPGPESGLAWFPVRSPESHPMLKILIELEEILLPSGHRMLPTIMREFCDPNRVLWSSPDAQRVLRDIVKEMSTPVIIECEHKPEKYLRRFFGGVGTAIGSVLAIVGIIAALPGTLSALAAAAIMSDESRARMVIGTILMIPSVVLATPGSLVLLLGRAIVNRSLAAMQSPASQLYVQMLKLLFQLLNGDPAHELEEIPNLEIAICRQYYNLSQKPLHTATVQDVKDVLERLTKKSTHDSPCQLYHKALPDSKRTIERWFRAVGRFAKLRFLFLHHVVLSFVGTHNSGKSSMIRALFGCDAKSDFLERTSTIQLFRLKSLASYAPRDSPAREIRRQEQIEANINNGHLGSSELTVDVADFPGSTDERVHIASVLPRIGDITTLFVCMFRMGHVAAPERAIMETVRRKGNDYIVFINQCDLFEDELQRREDDIRQNYARTLNVDPGFIIFTSTKMPARVEYVRRLLFSLLSVFVDQSTGELASTLLAEKDKVDLAGAEDLMSQLLDTENAIARLLRDPVSEKVTVQQVRDRMAPYGPNYVPKLIEKPATAASASSASPSGERRGSAGSRPQASGPQATLEAGIAEVFSQMGYSARFVQCAMFVSSRLLADQLADIRDVENLVVRSSGPSAPAETSSPLPWWKRLRRSKRNSQGAAAAAAATSSPSEASEETALLNRETPPPTAALAEGEEASPQPAKLELDTRHPSSVSPSATPQPATNSLYFQAQIMLISEISYVLQELVKSFGALGFSEEAVFEAIESRVTFSDESLTVQALLEDVHRVQKEQQQRRSARNAPQLIVSTPTPQPSAEPEAPATATDMPGKKEEGEAIDKVKTDGETMQETPPLEETALVEDSERAVEEEALVEEQTVVAAPLRMVSFGLETFTLLMNNVRFRVQDRVRASDLYPELEASMPPKLRQAMFYDLLYRSGFNSDKLSITLLGGEEMVPSLLSEILQLTPNQLKGGVSFFISGEAAVDVKGVLRSVMTALSQYLRSGFSQFLTVVDNHHVYFGPYTYSHLRDASTFFLVLGRLVGLCLLNACDNVHLPNLFPLPVFKLLLGEELTFRDFEILHTTMAQSIKQMCMMTDEEFASLELTFSVDTEDGSSYELMPGGDSVAVVAENRIAYLQHRIWFYLGHNMPLSSFLLGVNHVCPRDVLAVFSAPMLQLLVSGQSTFSVQELREASTVSSQFAAYPLLVDWFWDCVEAMSDEERSLLLTFVTGSSTVPAEGVQNLHISLVMQSRGTPESLPVSHTCFNLLELPPYRDKETLKAKLLLAIMNVSASTFGIV